MFKKIKFNWGFGILLICLIFMGTTVVRVVSMMNKDVDLVTDNYYEKELDYQQQINKESRTASMKKEVEIKYSDKIIILNFNNPSTNIDGQVYFYRPSNSKMDFKIPLKVDGNGKQRIDASSIIKGMWHVQVSWNEKDKDFYSEQTIFVN